MMMFFGYELELFAGRVIVEYDGMTARSGSDFVGNHWLIAAVDDDPEHMVWVCAPTTIRALQELATGHATVADIVRHSSTGMVEVVSVTRGQAVPDRCLSCAELPEELLLRHGRLLATAA